jgi:hypothetical protein
MLFRIKPGHSFRDHDDSIKGAGELIELGEDAAQLHAQKIEPAEAHAATRRQRVQTTTSPGAGRSTLACTPARRRP